MHKNLLIASVLCVSLLTSCRDFSENETNPDEPNSFLSALEVTSLLTKTWRSTTYIDDDPYSSYYEALTFSEDGTAFLFRHRCLSGSCNIYEIGAPKWHSFRVEEADTPSSSYKKLVFTSTSGEEEIATIEVVVIDNAEILTFVDKTLSEYKWEFESFSDPRMVKFTNSEAEQELSGVYRRQIDGFGARYSFHELEFGMNGLFKSRYTTCSEIDCSSGEVLERESSSYWSVISKDNNQPGYVGFTTNSYRFIEELDFIYGNIEGQYYLSEIGNKVTLYRYNKTTNTIVLEQSWVKQ